MYERITMLRRKPRQEPRWSTYDVISSWCVDCQEELDFRFNDCDNCYERKEVCEHFACPACGDIYDFSE